MSEPNKEHLKILKQVTGINDNLLLETATYGILGVLTCMQILQDEIDRLKQENDKLHDLINFCQCDQPGWDYGDTVYCARCHKPFDPKLS